MAEATAPYKVVLVFNLKPGAAEEELKRSLSEDSFPARLAREAGFLGLELVKLSEDRTMSIQTWRSERDWWTALGNVKNAQVELAQPAPEEILISRDFFGGAIVGSRAPHSATQA
jgi:heme-degrading monooxygenase HmoA